MTQNRGHSQRDYSELSFLSLSMLHMIIQSEEGENRTQPWLQRDLDPGLDRDAWIRAMTALTRRGEDEARGLALGTASGRRPWAKRGHVLGQG